MTTQQKEEAAAETGHSLYSPSSAAGWMRCTAYVAMNEGRKDCGSDYALEGTAAHWLASESLIRSIHPTGIPETHYVDERTGEMWEITGEMRAHVADYVEHVCKLAAGNELHVEQRVPWGEAIGVERFGLRDQFGTSDAIILNLDDDELTVEDLKFGMGVRVDATDNEQLKVYAVGARYQFGLDFEPKKINLIIHQPRLNHVSEWSLSGDDLTAFEDEMRVAIGLNEEARQQLRETGTIDPGHFAPNDKSCRWCKAQGDCAAYERWCLEKIVGEFDDESDPKPLVHAAVEKSHTIPPERLGKLLEAAPMIESWLKAIRARTEAELFAGNPVPGWKLVEGKAGNRAWSNEEEAEKILRSFRLPGDEMYSKKLISPTQAEKLLSAYPRRWLRLATLITRSAGKPSVAPVTDKRPEYTPGAKDEDFENLNEVEAEEV